MKSGLLLSVVGCCATGAIGFYFGSQFNSPATLPIVVSPSPTTPPVRIALVDMQQCFNRYPLTKKSEDAVNAMWLEAKAEWQRLTDTGDNAGATHFSKTRTKEIEAEAERLRVQIVTELQAFIINNATKKECNLVLDSSGKGLTGIPVVLRATGVPDITEDILRDIGQ